MIFEKPKTKYLFFDFDGTISDAYDISYESLKKTLDDFGYKYEKTKLKKFLGNRMETIFNKLGLDNLKIKKARRRFYGYFKKAALNGGIKLCVPIEPLFELKKKGCKLIIVSNSETSFLKASIRKLKINGLFDKVYGADKFTTKDILLEKLFRKYKIKPSNAFYVGDRFSDVEFARKAGCVAVAIHNKCSWSSLSSIKKEKPDYIIKDFGELERVAGRI